MLNVPATVTDCSPKTSTLVKSVLLVNYYTYQTCYSIVFVKSRLFVFGAEFTVQ